METYFGTPGNDSWTLHPGYVLTIDGLAGIDTVYFGTAPRSSFTIARNGDGSVQVDTVSGASGGLHVKLYNIEFLSFANRSDTIELAQHFGDTQPPVASFEGDATGTASGNIHYRLRFSEPVTGLSAGDFAVGNGRLLEFSGSGASYEVVVAPAAQTEGLLMLGLLAGAVTDLSGNPNPAAAAPGQAIDTRAPTLAAFNPAALPAGPLVFVFSEPVQFAGGSLIVKTATGALVARYDTGSSARLGLDGAVLTLNPGSDLAAGTDYRLDIAADSLRDAAGHPFAGVRDLAFRTASVVNTLTGSSRDDVFVAGNGQVLVNGLGGVDSLLFAQPRSAYAVHPTADGFSVSEPGTGNLHALRQVERLRFADGLLALDLDGHAGQAVKVLSAVFGPAAPAAHPDYLGLGLALLDTGLGYEALVQRALDARLGPAPTPTQVVDLLYGNVVGVAPSAAAQAYFVGLLNNQTYTPASLGVLAADHELNLLHVDLVGLASTGIDYNLGLVVG